MREIRVPAAAWRRRLGILVAVCGGAAGGAFGQTGIAWQNPAGGAWEHGPNWDSGAAPGPADRARFAIGGGSYLISFATNAQAMGVTVDGDDVTLALAANELRFAPSAWSLRVGEGTSTSRLSITGGTLGAGPAAFSGSMLVGSAGRIDVTGAGLEGHDVAATVDGRLAVGSTGRVHLTGSSELLVNGLATVDGAGSFISPAEMTITGQLAATNGGWAAAGNGRLTLSPGSVVTADGGEIRGLDIEATGAQINLAGGGRLIAEFGPLNLNAGTILAGSGQVLSDGGIVNAGVVEPGLAGGGIGSLFFSNLEMADSGRLVMELAGLDGGTGYDVIHTDFALLAGTLDVSLASGFMPVAGATFDVLTGSCSGEFLTVNLPSLGGGMSFDVLYGSDFVRLAVIPAPASGAGALLCVGVIGMRRRR